LQSGSVANVEYYPEYLESNRFPGEFQEAVLRDYLRQKYADRTIDVVVANTDAAMDFLLKYRSVLFPRSPIVFLGIKKPTPDQLMVGPGITGILPASTHKQTLDLALSLHPGTEQVFFISGTPERDKRFETVARQELAGYESRVRIIYLTDLPLQELIATTKSLPQRSIILYGWQQSHNSQGELLETWQTLAAFAPTASAPIYGMGSVNVGYGCVGGYVAGSETNGTAMGQIVVRILKGEPAQGIPVADAPAFYMFDWRELKRWGLSERSLPPGSIINFRQFTFWERYKWRIISVTTLFLLQTAFIAILLIERKRRQRAKQALDQLNAELEQRIATRTAALASKSRELEAFTYSVAHDLKAPLRGINGYSRLLLEDFADKLNPEGQRFVQTIRSSTQEMDQLIEDLLDYSRLERRELKTDQIELQALVKAVVAQKERETTEREIDVIVNVNGGSVVADVKGLTQALNNYLDNAIKFTQKVAQPRIEVGSEDTTKSYVLWVRDNGVGFDMQYSDRIFEIFQRLNHSEEYPGTGIGLAIVRKAMERMGGRAWAESEPGEGATFYLEIPKPRPSDLKL
jgi:signal transduction histidine kinase